MIRVERVCKSFGNESVLSELSFEIAAGGRLAVVGPSGCGKTTLLRLLAGLDLPEGGDIYLHDQLASRPGWGLPPYERHVGFAFQTPTLWPHMTAAQNILFGVNDLAKDEKRRRLEELAAAFGISGLLRRYPGQISGGEARRVSLARALAPKPPILLLDEPLTNLDKDRKAEVLAAMLGWIAAYSPTVVYVSHDEQEAAAVSDSIFVLHK